MTSRPPACSPRRMACLPSRKPRTNQPTPVAEASSSQADALALMKADQVDEAGGKSRSLAQPPGCRDKRRVASKRALRALAGRRGRERDGRVSGGSTGRPGSDRIEHAELGVPTTLLLISAAAYRLRQFSGRWWRRIRVCARHRWPPPEHAFPGAAVLERERQRDHEGAIARPSLSRSRGRVPIVQEGGFRPS